MFNRNKENFLNNQIGLAANLQQYYFLLAHALRAFAKVSKHVLAESDHTAEDSTTFKTGCVSQVDVNVVDTRLVEIKLPAAHAADEFSTALDNFAGYSFSFFEHQPLRIL